MKCPTFRVLCDGDIIKGAIRVNSYIYKMKVFPKYNKDFHDRSNVEPMKSHSSVSKYSEISKVKLAHKLLLNIFLFRRKI